MSSPLPPSVSSKSSYVYLTRIESFSSSHRLHCTGLSDEANASLYGKCNNANGHGHNYKVEVTVKGLIDSMTGMVMNISDLKNIISQTVMDVLDHRNIDRDVTYFRDFGVVSTAENIVVFIWELISPKLPENVELHSIKLHETDKNVVEYRGEVMHFERRESSE